MKRLAFSSLAVVLALVFIVGCNAKTVQAYVNLATGIALQVAKLAGLNQATADQVSGDLATANKLYSDYLAADAAAKPGIVNEIDTYLTVAQTDLSAILTAAHVVDPKKQAAISAGIGLAITAVEAIRGFLPQAATSASTTGAVKAKSATVTKKVLTPAQLKAAYNQSVAAYPQSQLK